MKLPVKVCRSCIALGLVICLYGPLVWAQDAAHVWGPDWQQIALWFGGLILFFIGVFAQWQRTAIATLAKRITDVEKAVVALDKLLIRDEQSRAHFQQLVQDMVKEFKEFRETLTALHRRLDQAGVAYQPK